MRVLGSTLCTSIAYSAIEVEVLNHMRVSFLTKGLCTITFRSLWRCKDLW